MTRDRDRDLLCTALCRHGPEHRHSSCRFAHALSELRSPIESTNTYSELWQRGAFDRFYGQRLGERQLATFCFYFRRTPSCDLPQWAIGLYLLVHGQECLRGRAHSWDFGIVADYRDLLARRRDASLPFPVMDGLWDRLSARREVLRLWPLPFTVETHLISSDDSDTDYEEVYAAHRARVGPHRPLRSSMSEAERSSLRPSPYIVSSRTSYEIYARPGARHPYMAVPRPPSPPPPP